MQKPALTRIKSSQEFLSWYWLKTELVEICKGLGLPYGGSKFELRDRIVFALDNGGKIKPRPARNKAESDFDWANARLSPETRITDSVSFGPNFRNFMATLVAGKFTCSAAFMRWVRSNPGRTLRDAAIHWHELEERRRRPGHRNEIAKHNMLNQYVRDYLAENEGHALKQALHCWKRKKRRPAPGGVVRYESSDLKL